MNAMCLRNYNCTIGSIVNKYRHKLFAMTTICAIHTHTHMAIAQVLLKLHVNCHSFGFCHKASQHNAHVCDENVLRLPGDIASEESNDERKNTTKKKSHVNIGGKPKQNFLHRFFRNADDVRVSFVWRYCLGLFWLDCVLRVFITELVYLCVLQKHRLHHIYSIMKILHVLRFQCIRNFVIVCVCRYRHTSCTISHYQFP